jgi:hypothetical protein
VCERERERNSVTNFISSDVEVVFAPSAYEFPEDAAGEAVCVMLSSAAERAVTVLLNTSDLTALGQNNLNHTLKSDPFYKIFRAN